MLQLVDRFKPRCPKCSSAHIDVVSIWGWTGADQCLTCHTCGTQRFGTAAIQELFAAQETAWQEAKQAKEEKAAASSPAVIQEPPTAPLLRLDVQAGPISVDGTPIAGAPTSEPCARNGCPNTRTQTSIYCARACKDKVSRERAKLRAKRTVEGSAPSPLSTIS
jgi:hypothetical protein